MKSVFKLQANNVDVTSVLQKNIISIDFTDEDGERSDEIQIKITGDFKRPKYRDSLKLWLGYEGESLFYCGEFLVQSTQRDNNSLNINASSTNFSSSLKEKRNTSYEKNSLKEIALAIGLRNNLNVKSDCDEIYVKHFAQTHESDLHMLYRIAKEYHLVFSIKNETILLLQRKKMQKSLEIDVKECTSYSIEHTNKTQYNSCEVLWHDTKSNQVKSVIVGEGNPVLKLKGSYSSHVDARTKAEAALHNSNKMSRKGSISMNGRELYAGTVIKLIGAKEDDGNYIVKSLRHSLNQGWSIDFEIEQEAQE